MLFGRVTDFGVRTNLRAAVPMSRIQNPFLIPGFEELDGLVSTEFFASFPPRFKNSFSELESMYGGGGLDTDLYMVHLVPHAYVTFIRLCDQSPHLPSFKCDNYVAQPLRRFLGSSERLNFALCRSIACHPYAALHARIFII
jgi:hypothetical protein